ncbi:hypothetical protein ES703_01760 [subsurface metagenome]
MSFVFDQGSTFQTQLSRQPEMKPVDFILSTMEQSRIGTGLYQ